jgi:hypothetical protein
VNFPGISNFSPQSREERIRKRVLILYVIMTLKQFKISLTQLSPPQGLSDLLSAMWYDGKGDWETSHNIAQEIHSKEGSWIHAYLHRKEGDSGNAAYWYAKAGKKFPAIGLELEWEELCLYFLGLQH